jgi:putative hydrolase of the HAD superfamily
MPTRAVLFDLDDTLVRDTDATWAALRATAELATPRGLDVEALAQTAYRGAKEAWKRSLYRPYFEEFGISAGECLWGRFVGEDPRLRSIGAWAARMQWDCWAGALGHQGAHDDILAATLAERFRVERRTRHGWLYPEIRATLDALEERYALALVTNGAPDIQRDKLAGSGLEGYFATVQVSCEAGAGKPDPAIFVRVLEALGAAPDGVVMVGDNPATDVLGANRAGIRAIWLRRAHQRLTRGARPAATIVSLSELPALL